MTLGMPTLVTSTVSIEVVTRTHWNAGQRKLLTDRIERKKNPARRTKDIQIIFRTSTYCFWPVLTPLRTPTSHAAVEMHWNLIIPSSYDSLLCWLVWWLLGCCHGAAETQGVQVLLLWFSFTYLLTYSYIFHFLPLLPKTTITFRWTTSCCRMCVMRRQWPRWRTPPTWFISRWPSLDRCISMTCMRLRTTQAVRIYLFLQVQASNTVENDVGLFICTGVWG